LRCGNGAADVQLPRSAVAPLEEIRHSRRADKLWVVHARTPFQSEHPPDAGAALPRRVLRPCDPLSFGKAWPGYFAAQAIQRKPGFTLVWTAMSAVLAEVTSLWLLHVTAIGGRPAPLGGTDRAHGALVMSLRRDSPFLVLGTIWELTAWSLRSHAARRHCSRGQRRCFL